MISFRATQGKARGNKAIIFVSDVWGWDSGRVNMIQSVCIQPNASITTTCTRQVRLLADHFAEAGYYCVVPKLLNEPAFEGGTDGFVINFAHTRVKAT